MVDKERYSHVLPAREGEVPEQSDSRVGIRSELWCSEDSLGGERQIRSGELAEVTAAEGLELFSFRGYLVLGATYLVLGAWEEHYIR